jgi:hypothetical protein
VKSDVVEFPVMLLSTPWYLMTAIQDPIRPLSPAERGTVRGRLVFSLLTIEGVLVFDLFSMFGRSKVFREVGGCIFRAPEYFVFG